WDVHGPRPVTEMALQLPDDGRHGISRQLDAAIRVEAVDRVDERDRADLYEIVEGLAAAGETAGQRTHERHQVLDQLLACGLVAVSLVGAEKALPFEIRGHRHVPPERPAAATVNSTQSPPPLWPRRQASTARPDC